jgi:hypothetical protein
MPDPVSGGALGLAAVCGQAAIVISAVMVAACAARVWPRARRVQRKARVLRARARQDGDVLFDGLALLLGQSMETDRLLEPWRRVFFWLRHPLTRALWDQYRPERPLFFRVRYPLARSLLGQYFRR